MIQDSGLPGARLARQYDQALPGFCSEHQFSQRSIVCARRKIKSRVRGDVERILSQPKMIKKMLEH
jgi:hypothetical protein